MKPSAALACPRPSGDAAAARFSSGCRRRPQRLPELVQPAAASAPRAGAAARLSGLKVPAEGWVRGVLSPGEPAALPNARLPSASRRWSRPLDARSLPSSSEGSLLREVPLRGRSAAARRRRAAAKAVRLSVPRRADWCSSASERGRGRSLGDVSIALYGVGEHGLRAEPRGQASPVPGVAGGCREEVLRGRASAWGYSAGYRRS